MGYVLVGLVAILVPPAVTLLVAVAVGMLAARWLGIPDFRPFRRGAPETRWKRFGVRAASVAAAFTTCFVLGVLAARVSGTHHPTLVVDVQPGPAREAGLRDGDRIVAIDGKTHGEWDSVRMDIQSSTGPRTVTFERNGERLERVVDPMPERRMGLSARSEARPATAGEVIKQGFAVCFAVFRAFREKKVEFVGPVGVVKASSRSSVPRHAFIFYAAAIYSSYVWIGLALVHLVAALALHFGRKPN